MHWIYQPLLPSSVLLAVAAAPALVNISSVNIQVTESRLTVIAIKAVVNENINVVEGEESTNQYIVASANEYETVEEANTRIVAISSSDSQSDTIQITESPLYILSVYQVKNENINLEESIKSSLAIVQVKNENINLEESIKSSLAITHVKNEDVQVVEGSFDQAVFITGILADALNVSENTESFTAVLEISVLKVQNEDINLEEVNKTSLTIVQVKNENVTLEETSSSRLGIVQVKNENVTVTEQDSRRLGIVQVKNENVTVTEQDSRRLGIVQVKTENVTISENVVTSSTISLESLVKIWSENVTLEETSSSRLGIVQVKNENVTSVELSGISSNIVQSVIESISIIENRNTALSIVHIKSENVQVVEGSFNQGIRITGILNDNINVTENTVSSISTAGSSITKIQNETVNLEELSSMFRLVANGSENITITEESSYILGIPLYYRNETVDVVENIVSSIRLVHIKNETIDVVEGSGDLEIRLMGSVLDDITVIENTANSIAYPGAPVVVKVENEIVNINDGNSSSNGYFVGTQNTNVSITESVTRVTGLIYIKNEAVNVTENVVRDTTIPFVFDIVGVINETINVEEYGRNFLGYSNVQIRNETVDVVQGSFDLGLTFIGIADSEINIPEESNTNTSSPIVIRVVNETVNIVIATDDFDINSTSNAYDNVSITESVTKSSGIVQVKNENVTILENNQFIELVSSGTESINVSENIVSKIGIVRIKNENVTVTEQVSRRLGIVQVKNENVNITEQKTGNTKLVYIINDQISISENVNAYLTTPIVINMRVRVPEDVLITESVSSKLGIVAINREDVILTESSTLLHLPPAHNSLEQIQESVVSILKIVQTYSENVTSIEGNSSRIGIRAIVNENETLTEGFAVAPGFVKIGPTDIVSIGETVSDADGSIGTVLNAVIDTTEQYSASLRISNTNADNVALQERVIAKLGIVQIRRESVSVVEGLRSIGPRRRVRLIS